MQRGEKAALEAQITTLKEERDWLRERLDAAVGFRPQELQSISAPPMEMGKLWTSDEETDIQDMLDNDLIDKDEATRMLEAAGALSADVEYAPTQ